MSRLDRIEVTSDSEVRRLDIPARIASSLEALDIDYELEQLDGDLLSSRIRRANTHATQLARAFLLQTPQQKIQLISSTNALCRLDIVADHVGEAVTPIPLEVEQQLAARNGFSELPAIPQALQYQSYIDEQLLSAQKIYLPCGVKDKFILISGDDFNKLVAELPRIKADVLLDQINNTLSQQQYDAENLQNAIRNYTSLRIKKRLTETLEIPPLSTSAEKIIKLSADPNADAAQLVDIVELDPSLSAQVVGWAASPYYSAPGKVNSIHDAIVRVLGFELVMSLAMGLAIGKTLDVPQDNPDGITSFWRQSVYCAITMEKLNRQLPAKLRGSSGLCYLSGLLNNFGYLVLAHVFRDHFSQVCRYLEANRHLHHTYIEFHLLGICRDQISSELMRIWNLPDEITTALRFQQLDNYCNDHHLYANLLFIAKRLLAAKGIGDIPASVIPVSLYERFELEPSNIEQAVEEVFEQSDEIDAMTSIFSG